MKKRIRLWALRAWIIAVCVVFVPAVLVLALLDAAYHVVDNNIGDQVRGAWRG